MKKILIAAGVAGLAYYLKRHPEVVNDLKGKATDALNKVKGRMNHSDLNTDMNTVH
ncbi:MAG TPA: hypothetical protein VF145_13080 [Chitinophagaceae bacterium]